VQTRINLKVEIPQLRNVRLSDKNQEEFPRIDRARLRVTVPRANATEIYLKKNSASKREPACDRLPPADRQRRRGHSTSGRGCQKLRLPAFENLVPILGRTQAMGFLRLPRGSAQWPADDRSESARNVIDMLDSMARKYEGAILRRKKTTLLMVSLAIEYDLSGSIRGFSAQLHTTKAKARP